MSESRGQEPEYLHGTEAAEQKRLELQAKLLGGADFLPPLSRGAKMLDVGCGTGAIAREVATRVSPGEVIGVDREKAQLATARRLASEQGIDNIHFQHGDAANLDFPDGAFHAAYCRFLLEHVAEPPAVIREMARVVAPGGWVCAYEWENGCFAVYPDSPAVMEVWDAVYRLQELLRSDPWIARKLYGVFRQAGLEHVNVKGFAWTATAAERDKLQGLIDGAREITRQTREGLLVEKLATDKILAQAEREYQMLLEHSETFILAGFCRAVGTKNG